MLKNRLTIKHITLLGLLTALCTVARIAVLPLPNVQPVTDTLMLITLFLGVGDGLVLGILTMLVSNMFLGFGIWTLPQIAAYVVCILLVGGLSKITPLKKVTWLQLAVCVFLGFFYGFLVSLGMAVIGQAPAFWAYLISGLLFDCYHAIGNVVFYPLLAWLLPKLLARYFSE
ncbi:membrane protein [Ligilactobacillus salitolerans]|uniref:Membrane protein n=1 Tax=Ligilactobacillus salitolerans TaxID=1808352 RepID=A0A401IQJ0_9LACO|nr:ECF transporter S component [Ligilactobacillus salitolerans]GBG93764.1 membrane protein [Ligilactobacillus salitolerans]